jgi:Flp pilus assembly pilin Flp
MKKMFLSKLKTFLKEESGASMVEYAVALLVVTAIGVTAMSNLGDEVKGNVDTACNTLADAATDCG